MHGIKGEKAWLWGVLNSDDRPFLSNCRRLSQSYGMAVEFLLIFYGGESL